MTSAGADLADEVERLVALGATVRDAREGTGITLLGDPDGNDFTVQVP